MFDKITIQNFQSFRDKTIPFCDGVNAIVGLSRSGKTTILRAIRWCVENEPKGDAFQSWWGGDPLVRIQLADGVAVTRKRHNEDNFYIIERPGEKDLVLTAFGVNVPEEVQAIFNMDSTNLQAQMDGVFFLSLHPREVAKSLNQAVNLDIIDTSTTTINRSKAEADKALKFEKTRPKGIEEKISSFDYLEQLEGEIKAVEDTGRRLKSVKERTGQLEACLKNLQSNADDSEYYDGILGAGVEIDAAFSLVEKISETQREMGAIGFILNKIKGIDDDIARFQKISGAAGELEEVQKALEAREINADAVAGLEGIVIRIKSTVTKISRAEMKLSDSRKEFKEIMPDNCPICDSPQKAGRGVGVSP